MTNAVPSEEPHGLGLRLRGGAARRWAVDGVIAAVVTAAQVSVAQVEDTHFARSAGAAPVVAHVPALAYVLLIVGGLSLIVRRRFPAAVLAAVLATTLWAGALGASVIWLAQIVAFFTAVLARKRAAAVASMVVGYLGSVWPPWLIGRPGHTTPAHALALAVGLILMLSAAELIRSRSQRAAALERSREEEYRRRASEERMRMARDLHDVVAHNISVINVQASTALHLMERQPDRARSALTIINEVSKQALVELRSVLGVLRDVDENAPRAPAPGLARIGDLIDHAAAAGLSVRVEEEGDRVPLPVDIDLVAYRIVQEALTNSARHSGGATATVRLTHLADGLMVEVTDNGAPRPPGRGAAVNGTTMGSGNGIVGMAERAAAIGGRLHAGSRPEGGFRVRAWLPLRQHAD
ncbi:MAG TPA: histidine kinase [Streptosporangiaceae bacterium]|nr:histidine kinase [Streptosporangiaceae bacterium]